DQGRAAADHAQALRKKHQNDQQPPAAALAQLNQQFNTLLSTIVQQNSLAGLRVSWKDADVPYFWPEAPLPDGQRSGYIGNKFYHRDVEPFLADVLIACTRYGPQLVACNIHTHYRGSAQIWYLDRLSQTEKIRLMNENSPDAADPLPLLRLKLLEVFRDVKSNPLSQLIENRFTVQRLLNNEDAFSWAQEQLGLIARSGMTTEFQQLQALFNCFDPQLQDVFPEPDMNSTVNTYLSHLRAKATSHRAPLGALPPATMLPYAQPSFAVQPYPQPQPIQYPMQSAYTVHQPASFHQQQITQPSSSYQIPSAPPYQQPAAQVFPAQQQMSYQPAYQAAPNQSMGQPGRFNGYQQQFNGGPQQQQNGPQFVNNQQQPQQFVNNQQQQAGNGAPYLPFRGQRPCRFCNQWGHWDHFCAQ
ncbi:hypothetical protein BJ508DRAFT_315907, partial [Ascobolus immersus RN42]